MKDLSAYSFLSELNLERILTGRHLRSSMWTHTDLYIMMQFYMQYNAVFLCVCLLTYLPSDNSFSEISGLEHCCMLTHLNLGHNKISRISGLKSLPLTHLCLVGPPTICSAMCTFIRTLTQYLLLEIFHTMYFTSCALNHRYFIYPLVSPSAFFIMSVFWLYFYIL